MFYGNAYNNRETSQQRLCHCDLLSQNVHLKKVMSKQSFVSMQHLYITCEKSAYLVGI